MPQLPIHDVTVTTLGHTVTLTPRYPPGLKGGPARLVMTHAEARALALSLPHLNTTDSNLNLQIAHGRWAFVFTREGANMHIYWLTPDGNADSPRGQSTETIEYLQGALLKDNHEPQGKKGAQNHALDVRPAPHNTTNGHPPGVVLISHRQGHSTEVHLALETAHALAEFAIIEKLNVMLGSTPTSVLLSRHGQILNLKFWDQVLTGFENPICNLNIPANTLGDLQQKLRNAITSAKTPPQTATHPHHTRSYPTISVTASALTSSLSLNPDSPAQNSDTSRTIPKPSPRS